MREKKIDKTKKNRKKENDSLICLGNFSGSCKPGTIGDNVVLDLLHNETRNRVER